MKIYFDGIIYSWKTGGGVYRYFEEIINSCGKNKNIETTLLLHSPSYTISEKEGVTIRENITYFKNIQASGFKSLRKIFSPINKILLERYFKNISSGIFHSTYYTTYKNLKIPQVLTVHDMTHEKFPSFFNSNGAKRFIANKKKCILNANLIICVSEATKKSLVNTYKIDDKKIFVVHHGISENFTSNVVEYRSDLLDEPYFLFVGNRGLYKNFNFLLEAFSKWNKNKDYNLLLTGGDDLSGEELLLINKLDLNKQIKHLGFVDDKYFKNIYQKSEAFIFPSLDEGFGLPILEAISSKAQVIASDIEVFKEIGEDMILYFNPTKIESLINALDLAIFKKQTSEELEKRSEYIINKFSWKNCINKTLEIYNKTLNEKSN